MRLRQVIRNHDWKSQREMEKLVQKAIAIGDQDGQLEIAMSDLGL